MCRLGGFLIVVGALPTIVGAQDLRVLRERQAREAAVGTALSRELEERRSFERRYRNAADSMVIARGNITVYFQKQIADTGRAAARQADSILAGVGELLQHVQGSVVYIGVDNDPPEYMASTPGPKATVQFAANRHKYPTVSIAEIAATDIARQIEGTTMSRIVSRMRTPFLRWYRATLPLREEDLERETDWGTVRFDLLESRTVLGPRCYRGDIIACSMQLGFMRVEDPVMTWYDSLARVSLVRERRTAMRRRNMAATDACLAGADTACRRPLIAFGYDEPQAGSWSRDAVTSVALRLGGRGAVQRLLLSTAEPDDALAAAAGVPIDSVVRTWQRRVRGDSLGSDDLSLMIALVAVGWVGLLLFFSTRISRWR